MHIGLQIPNFTYPNGTPHLAATLKIIAQTADQGGFYSLWVMDHLFQIRFVGPAELEMLECYATLNYFAALTQHVKLGGLVTAVVYRQPGLLLKTVTTLDVLSGGRAYLGIGAAWFEREALGLGLPFPSLKDRFEQLEETLQIAKQMWAGTVAPYHGKHYTLAETLVSPLPLTKPHPPIMIGGEGEKKTLRLVAQYGDACNLYGQLDDAELRKKLDILKAHCDDVGRDYATIEKTALEAIAPTMDADAIIARCRRAYDLGFSHLIFNMPHVHEITPVEMIARDVIPTVSAWA
jgi:F420-dependent oxidoreductase-like protein